jgi:hypothetical protein
MGKKRQIASQPLPSPVYVNFGDRWVIIRGMQKFFGFLAYPPLPSNHPQARDVPRLRNAFMHTIEAEAIRSYTNGDTDRTEIARKVMPLKIIGKALGVRGKRVIEGGFNYGFKDRIAMRRMLAARVALPILIDAGVVESVEKTGNENPRTVDEALHVLLDAKLDRDYLQWRALVLTARGRDWYNRQFQDFKKQVWYESLPVLHLAIALCLTMRRDLEPAVAMYLLLKDPRWLRDTLDSADTQIRLRLHKFFPEFNPATAVQIIPVVPVITTKRPALAY